MFFHLLSLLERPWHSIKHHNADLRVFKRVPNHIYYGVNGTTGKVTNMKDLKVWDTLAVKRQTLKTAVEVEKIIFIYIYIFIF